MLRIHVDGRLQQFRQKYFEGTVHAHVTVEKRCTECHAEGKSGAPKLGDMNDWKPRLKNGVAPLVKSAINGHNAMPARGGLANLSDAEMKSAVEFMIGKTGGAGQAH